MILLGFCLGLLKLRWTGVYAFAGEKATKGVRLTFAVYYPTRQLNDKSKRYDAFAMQCYETK